MDFLKKIPSPFYIFLCWLYAEFFINPIGEFPLNDDWSYTIPVKHLLQDGNIKMVDWPAMTLVAQVWWGYLFTSVFGFSFSVLRISVTILGLAGSIYLFFILKDLLKNKNIAFAGSLLLLLNPLYFSLSNSFMTDVPFLSLFIIATYYYFRSIETHKIHHLILAAVFSAFAILVRQIGIFLPIAYLLLIIYLKWKTKGSFSLKLLIPLVISSVALASYEIWIHQPTHHMSTYQSSLTVLNSSASIAEMLWRFVLRCGVCLYYIGLFLFPLLAYNAIRFIKSYSKKQKLYLLFSLVGASVLLIRCFTLFPDGNIFYNSGVGPATLFDTFILKTNTEQNTSTILSISIQVVAFIGALFAAVHLFHAAFVLMHPSQNPQPSRKVSLFVFFLAVLNSSLFLLSQAFFDRYLLPILFLFLIVALISFKGNKFILYTYIILTSVFSLFTTHDYLQWNKQRWTAINSLIKEKQISTNEINGGFEYFGWNFSESNKDGWFEQWTSGNQKYLITFGEVKGYKKLTQINYQRLIPYKTSSIFVLEKE